MSGAMTVERTFAAPRALVWEAFTRREHLERWWGPRGFTTRIVEMDLRVGGAWRFVMRGPDGNDYPFAGTWREVAPPERLVFDGTIDGDPAHVVSTTVTFAERAGATTVTVHQSFNFESMATRGAREGWTQTLERLDEYVASRAR